VRAESVPLVETAPDELTTRPGGLETEVVAKLNRSGAARSLQLVGEGRAGGRRRRVRCRCALGDRRGVDCQGVAPRPGVTVGVGVGARDGVGVRRERAPRREGARRADDETWRTRDRGSGEADRSGAARSLQLVGEGRAAAGVVEFVVGALWVIAVALTVSE